MKTGRKLTTIELEVAIAEYFGIRANLIIPNMYYSYFKHELDLMILTKSGCAYEVEIKINVSDLKKDCEKWHGHRDSRIRKLYFAIPESLLKYQEYIPDHAGIFIVYEITEKYYRVQLGSYQSKTFLRVKKIREAKTTSSYTFSTIDRYKFARLAALRIWGLKKKIIQSRKEI